ncbi:class I SAM-dependent methyltransferase [Clostridium sp. SYSU_GA19001]|uniref:class I SAM-dependent methyltransferase n=1 Tax=Clostridium caldaquaticum TaxID=2940653 RepID=UPI0020775EF9|nr:class I SAM-dependent methyltransferase [Clostridium caldaquaticum]MCM8711334.1 class I SAM-dependent methyltransferase [Clostridium caldaquaticum]
MKHNSENTRKDIFINMQQEVFTGNVLDIGTDNYGVIYSLYKQYNDGAVIEYVHGREERELIEKGSYDSCILLFSLNNLWFKYNKRKFIKDISEYLKENGVLYIWDIDKGYYKFFKGKVKILLPDKKIKEINLLDMNIFKDTSKDATLKMLKEFFEIIDLKYSDNIYYIKARKVSADYTQQEVRNAEKGRTNVKNIINWNKFKVHSQQFGNKIFKSVHSRFKL